MAEGLVFNWRSEDRKFAPFINQGLSDIIFPAQKDKSYQREHPLPGYVAELRLLV